MPLKCCIPNCKRQQDDPGCFSLGFRKMPTDVNLKEKWLNSILSSFCEVKKEELTKKYLYICDLHFEESCFYYAGFSCRKMLTKGSYPTLFSNFKNNESSTHKLNTLEKIEKRNTFDNGNICISGNVNNLSNEENVCNIELKDKDVRVDEIADSTIFNDEDSSTCDTNNLSSEIDVQTNVASLDTKNMQTTNHKPSFENEIQNNDSRSMNLVNFDIESIDFSKANNVEEVKQLLLKGQVELKAKLNIIASQAVKIAGQRRLIKSLRMKLYRQ